MKCLCRLKDGVDIVLFHSLATVCFFLFLLLQAPKKWLDTYYAKRSVSCVVYMFLDHLIAFMNLKTSKAVVCK